MHFWLLFGKFWIVWVIFKKYLTYLKTVKFQIFFWKFLNFADKTVFIFAKSIKLNNQINFGIGKFEIN